MTDIGHNNPPDDGVMRLAPVRLAMGDLRAQCMKAIDAAESFADACDMVAKQAGIKGPVLRAYVKAVVGDKLKDQQERAEQMSLLLDEVGG